MGAAQDSTSMLGVIIMFFSTLKQGVLNAVLVGLFTTRRDISHIDELHELAEYSRVLFLESDLILSSFDECVWSESGLEEGNMEEHVLVDTILDLFGRLRSDAESDKGRRIRTIIKVSSGLNDVEGLFDARGFSGWFHVCACFFVYDDGGLEVLGEFSIHCE